MAKAELQEREEESDDNIRSEILLHSPSAVSGADLLSQRFNSLASHSSGSSDSDAFQLGVGVCGLVDGGSVSDQPFPSSGSYWGARDHRSLPCHVAK